MESRRRQTGFRAAVPGEGRERQRGERSVRPHQQELAFGHSGTVKMLTPPRHPHWYSYYREGEGAAERQQWKWRELKCELAGADERRQLHRWQAGVCLEGKVAADGLQRGEVRERLQLWQEMHRTCSWSTGNKGRPNGVAHRLHLVLRRSAAPETPLVGGLGEIAGEHARKRECSGPAARLTLHLQRCEVDSLERAVVPDLNEAFRCLQPAEGDGIHLPPSRVDQHVAIGMATERSVTARLKD